MFYVAFCVAYYKISLLINPMKGKETTRILKSTEEAQVIIRDAITLIDEYFAI